MSRTPISDKLKRRRADPETAERNRSQVETIASLVPKDVCRRLVKKGQDSAMAELDGEIFLPDFDLSELDDVPDPDSNGSYEALEVAEFKRFVKSHHGKKFSDLPDLTPEEEGEHISEQVDGLAGMLAQHWASLLVVEHRELGSEKMFLDEQLLPVHPLNERYRNSESWLEVLTNYTSYFIELDDTSELQTAFAEVIKAEVVKSDDGFELIGDRRICRSDDGYYLE